VEKIGHERKPVLADTLIYSKNFCSWIMTAITILIKGMKHTMYLAATGVYTTSDSLWQQKCMAEAHIGDRKWQFPPWYFYTKQATISQSEI
jgi:leucyl aminopeptidase